MTVDESENAPSPSDHRLSSEIHADRPIRLMVDNETRKMTVRDLVIAVAIGIVGSIIVVGLIYFQAFASIAHIYLVSLSLGLWLVPCIMPLLIIRKPGASIIACLAMGVISALTSPFGYLAIFSLVIEGIIIELPFLVALYRKWHNYQFVISAILLSIMMGALAPGAVGVEAPSPMMYLLSVIIAMFSSLVCLFFCMRLARKLRDSGVLK